jgi:hypothetical protein
MAPSPSGRVAREAAVEKETPASILEFVKLVNGCRDDPEGISAKQSLVSSFILSGGYSLLDVMCWLHLERAVAINSTALLKIIRWQKPAAWVGNEQNLTAVQDATRPGLFVSSALESCSVAEMAGVVETYISSNAHVNVVDMLRYVNRRGFIQVDASALLFRVTDWKRPPPKDKEPANWRKLWEGDVPTGPPTYVNVRNTRGGKSQLAFLGSIDETGANPSLKTPADILLGEWQLQQPRMCIDADAGSMHPRKTDSEMRMCNLPQFYEWVALSQGRGQECEDAHGAGSTGSCGIKSRIAPPTADEDDAGDLHPPSPIIDLKQVMAKSIEEWQDELEPQDTDALLADSSINNVVFMKLKEVFCALLDAAALAGSWIIVDRTDGQGSASAELLLELALDRGVQRPIIVAIDSLERLGWAREGRRAHRMLNQLNQLFHNDEGASQTPNGTEKELKIDFMYSSDEFDSASSFATEPDSRLPFAVLDEHRRTAYAGTCDPSRKWRYFYVDGLFANATHYILKNNDRDEFNIEGISRMGHIYAHGDTRTYKRLRANMQQGKPIVMLHNSGGVVTAFSWLQRVMAFSRPPPPPDLLRGPLKFLIANLSNANWVKDFGIPEVLMMKGLADRAPQLFRKNVVSVDILTDTEEQTLEVITGCFAAAGGVPELGLGNAEVNVVFNAWNLHCTLCDNALSFWRTSVIAQMTIWTLSLITTVVAITKSSIGNGSDPAGAVLQRLVHLDADVALTITTWLGYAVLLLPIITALVFSMASKLLWRDKWSVCIMAATQLVTEIYKFRMATLEYDMSVPPMSTSGDESERLPLSRQIFVSRIQAFYIACVTDLSQASTIKWRRPKVSMSGRHEYRVNQESKPTLAQWYNIKRHVENHFYNTSWALPSGCFLNWISGLRPYLQQQTLREELRAVIEELVGKKKIVLKGMPLSSTESKRVREGLTSRLGLGQGSLDSQKDELRQLQREIVVELYKEQVADQKAEEEAAAAAAARLPPPMPKKVKSKVNAVAPAHASAPAQATAAASAPATAPASAPAKAGKASRKAATASLAPVDEEVFTDASEAMRKRIVELQGLKPGKLTANEKKDEKKKRKKEQEDTVAKDIEDDYLFGPLSVESYVIFRVRPLIEHYEKQASRLAFKLATYEVLGFVVNSLGAVLATINFTEWVTLTVFASTILTAIVEFTQLHDQVVSNNLALRNLNTLLVKWDSLSVVRRRTETTKSEVVATTERSIIDVVDACTTAASNTQTSVEKELKTDEPDDITDS